MRKTLMLATVCILPLAACGGSDEPSNAPPSGESEASSDKGKPDEAAAPAVNTEPAITREERRRRAALTLLQEKLQKTKDSDDRAELLAEVAQFGTHAKTLWPEVLVGFKDEESFTRAVALETAAKVDPVGCQPLLVQGLADDETEVREKAAAAWAVAGIKELSPLLDRIPEEFEGRVQFAIMVTVDKVGEKHHVPLVAKVLGDLDSGALKPTVRFLGRNGGKEHAATIAEYLERDDVDLRILTARTLKKIGEKSKPVLTGLAAALRDDEPSVREAAIDALKGLTGQDLGYEVETEEDAEEASKAWVEWISKNT